MWTLRPEERLREWFAFRKEIGQLPIEQACQRTTEVWSYAPYVNHYLDPTGPSGLISWPDPWTLLYENCYCDLAKSLGMLYTLYLSEHQPQDIKIIIATDYESRMDYNLVSLCQGKYILNFNFATVVNKKQLPLTLKIKHQYTAEDLKINLY
jgi:hypothetical protein